MQSFIVILIAVIAHACHASDEFALESLRTGKVYGPYRFVNDEKLFDDTGKLLLHSNSVFSVRYSNKGITSRYGPFVYTNGGHIVVDGSEMIILGDNSAMRERIAQARSAENRARAEQQKERQLLDAAKRREREAKDAEQQSLWKAPDTKGRFEGAIQQVWDTGAIMIPAATQALLDAAKINRQKVPDGLDVTAIYVQGDFSDSVDLDTWEGVIIRDGVYSFTTTSGERHTIKKYAALLADGQTNQTTGFSPRGFIRRAAFGHAANCHIMQVLDGGALMMDLDDYAYVTINRTPLTKNSLFYVEGDFSGFVDGERWKGTVVRSGVYRYESREGTKSVRRYVIVGRDAQ